MVGNPAGARLRARESGATRSRYATSPVLSVTWGDAHTRLRFPKNGAGDGGAMTSGRISVTRLRHLQPSAIASLLKKGLVYDTGRKRWCRQCRTFEIVLALTPAGMAERELADMLTADGSEGRRSTRRDALNEVQKPFWL
jgi:hypothetical protein